MAKRKANPVELGDGQVQVSILLTPDGTGKGYKYLLAARSPSLAQPLMSSGTFGDIEQSIGGILLLASAATNSSPATAAGMAHGTVIDPDDLLGEDW